MARVEKLVWQPEPEEPCLMRESRAPRASPTMPAFLVYWSRLERHVKSVGLAYANEQKARHDEMVGARNAFERPDLELVLNISRFVRRAR